jgi:hypothetical protein
LICPGFSGPGWRSKIERKRPEHGSPLPAAPGSALPGSPGVSTNEQNLDLQLDALRREGVRDPDVYTDKITGTKAERLGLNGALSHLRSGDTLVVWRLDRLARSLSNLIELVNRLAGGGPPSKA